MAHDNSQTTLQINLSPGDFLYASQTVPEIVTAHRSDVQEVIVVVDCCKPQATGIVNPKIRFPEPQFGERVEMIKGIAEQFRSNGTVDRIEYLTPSSELHRITKRKYLRNLISETHDYGGCALTSYFVGFEVVKTPLVVHYDADMLLYQSKSYSWIREGKQYLASHGDCLAVTPRVAPPVDGTVELPHKQDWPPYQKVTSGWSDTWFSTRCYLFDLEKFTRFLPLLTGNMLWDLLFRKVIRRGYPRSPEVMISRRVAAGGGYRVTLENEMAWLIHPREKGELFLRLLPLMLQAVADGSVPPEQRGIPDLDLLAWDQWLNKG